VHELAALKKRVQACFEAAALSTGCKADIRWGGTDYLDLKTNWPMAEAFEKNAKALGREFFPLKDIPPGFAGSTDMGNVSHRVPSIHPMLAVAPAGVIIHNAEFAKWAASVKGDEAVIDGAKALAQTALDLMAKPDCLSAARGDFAATAEVSKSALARLHERVPDSKLADHRHGGCGCA
jgi:metal-dependent amidase/aminoacylase/carboxypeptidase family protein